MDRSRTRIDEASDHREDRGLAAARGAEQHHELAPFDGEIYGVDRNRPAVGLADTTQLDQWLADSVLSRVMTLA